MSKRFRFAAAGWLLVAASAHAATVRDFYGRWKLTGQAGSLDVTTSPENGRRAIGQEMVISAGKAVSPTGTCATFPPRYSVKSAAALLKDWMVEPTELTLGRYELPKMAGVVTTACPQAIVLTSDELLVNLGNGYIYLASRVK